MVNMIGYGSLLSRKSFERTLPYRDIKLVWVKGYKRIFNIIPYRINLYKDADKPHSTVTNAIPEKNSRLSGIMFEITDEELEKLKMRETSFTLKEAEIIDFTTEKPLGKAFIFIGKKQRFGEDIIDNTLLPIKSYAEMCREAAYKLGEEFGKAWDNTTFLGDGRKI